MPRKKHWYRIVMIEKRRITYRVQATSVINARELFDGGQAELQDSEDDGGSGPYIDRIDNLQEALREGEEAK